MSSLDARQAGRLEGECRKDAAHSLLEARRHVYVRRARRALLSQLLEADTATADDVADRIGPASGDIDPRYLGTVPGPLALVGIIRGAGFTKSTRPSRHGSILTVWELADRPAALVWLAHNPDLPDPVPDDEDQSCPVPTSPPCLGPPATIAVSQQSLF